MSEPVVQEPDVIRLVREVHGWPAGTVARGGGDRQSISIVRVRDGCAPKSVSRRRAGGDSDR